MGGAGAGVLSSRGLALLAGLAGVAGAAVVVGPGHGACRPLRASDVPGPDVVAARSAADRACAKAVVRDWYGDGVVDRVFPLRCYGFALAAVPADMDYSTVHEDIVRAHGKRYLELHRRQRSC